MAEEKKIIVIGDDGSELSFYVLEQTKFLENNYLLVTEELDSDEVFLLKEQETQADETVYVFVEDEVELCAVSELFGELLEDIDIKVEK